MTLLYKQNYLIFLLFFISILFTLFFHFHSHDLSQPLSSLILNLSHSSLTHLLISLTLNLSLSSLLLLISLSLSLLLSISLISLTHTHPLTPPRPPPRRGGDETAPRRTVCHTEWRGVVWGWGDGGVKREWRVCGWVCGWVYRWVSKWGCEE